MFRNSPEHVLESLRKDLVNQVEVVSNLVDDYLSTPFWRWRRKRELFAQMTANRNELYDMADDVAYLSHCIYGD